MNNTQQIIPIEQAMQIAMELHRNGQGSQALNICDQVLQADPGNSDAHYLRGIISLQAGNLDLATRHMVQAVSASPKVPDFHNQLGMLYFQAGNPEIAERHFREAVALEPVFAEAHNNLGNLLRIRGEFQSASVCYRRALELKPDFAEAWNNLGVTCLEMGNVDEAIQCWEKTLALKPVFAEAHNNLGNARKAQGKFEAAVAHYREAIALRPDYAEAHNNLGVALMEQGWVDEAVASLRHAVSLHPGYTAAYSNLLLCGQYALGQTPEEIYREHSRYAERFEAPMRERCLPHSNSPEPERRLRVGYISPDFRAHSVAYFVEPVLARHDKSRFEVFCYFLRPRRDAVTDRLAAFADHWRDCAGMTDAQLDNRIREDGIDILVDLAGHTAGNRLTVFARKPAPVQVTWLGYPDTTGLSTMDYRLTDEYADPQGGTDSFCSEKLIRLEDTFLCYRPFDDAPEVRMPPSERNGWVTFGSLNSLAKIPPMIDIWGQILRRLPRSKLIIKAGNLQGGESSQRWLVSRFAEFGVAPERLILPGREYSTARHLAWYGEVDIALDSFPYNGTTTTCEALWMGVPVVTLAGERHVSRVGASLLSNVGLPELIAKSSGEYLEIALELAGDLERLRGHRQTLRRNMQASPLMHERKFTTNLEKAYRHIWREWCHAHGGKSGG